MVWRYLILASMIVTIGCNSTREFWNYVVDDDVEKPMAERTPGNPDNKKILSPHNVKVVYNDGKTSTEVLIPILSSGQQIVLENQYERSPTGLSVVAPPPTSADKDLEDEYAKQGLPINQKANPVSIVETHEKIKELVKAGNYGIALQYIDLVLKRYPNHVKSLQLKGSLLLKMGERKASLNAYYKAQEIEPDAKVQEQIQKLEKALQ